MKLKVLLIMLSTIAVIGVSGCSFSYRIEIPLEDSISVETESATGVKISDEVVRVPYSLLKFSGMTTDEFINSCEEVHGYSVVDYVDGDYIDIIISEDIEDIIHDNNIFVEDLIVEFTESSSEYYINGSDDYKSLDIGIDEYFDTDLLMKTLTGIISEYGYNQVLMGTTDWSVYVTVYNCHTGNIVNSGKIPYEEFEVTSELWEDSYR